MQVKQRDEQRQERVPVRAIPTEEEALALALAGSMEQSAKPTFVDGREQERAGGGWKYRYGS